MSQKERLVDWAYDVIFWVRDMLNYGAENEDVVYEVVRKLQEKIPEIFDALMVLVSEEHRGVMADLMKAVVNFVARRRIY